MELFRLYFQQRYNLQAFDTCDRTTGYCLKMAAIPSNGTKLRDQGIRNNYSTVQQ
jgi:hypothetical protein